MKKHLLLHHRKTRKYYSCKSNILEQELRLGEFYDNYERVVQAYKFGPESRYHDNHENTKRYCKIGSLKVGKEYQLV